MGKWLGGGLGGSEELPEVLDVIRASLAFTEAIALLELFWCAVHYSCSGSVLCCSAGGWEEEEDADEIWIISISPLSVWLSPTLLAPLLFNVTPPTQPAAVQASGCCTPPPPFPLPPHPYPPSTAAHKHLYPSSTMMKHLPPPSATALCRKC